MSVCQYVSMSVCQYVSMSVCQYVSMSVCQYVNMSVCQYVRMQLFSLKMKVVQNVIRMSDSQKILVRKSLRTAKEPARSCLFYFLLIAVFLVLSIIKHTFTTNSRGGHTGRPGEGGPAAVIASQARAAAGGRTQRGNGGGRGQLQQQAELVPLRPPPRQSIHVAAAQLDKVRKHFFNPLSFFNNWRISGTLNPYYIKQLNPYYSEVEI